MPKPEVHEHLADYAGWLQRSTGLDLAPTDSAIASVESVTSPKWSRGRIVVMAVVSVLAIVGAVSLVRSDSPRSVVAAASDDPPGALYVLPTPLDAEMLRNAQVSETSEPVPEPGGKILVVGIPSGDSYIDLAIIWVGGLEPERNASYTPIELTSGPAEIWDDLFTIIVQERDGVSIRVMTDIDQVDYASDIVNRVTIDNEGSASIEAAGTFEVIESANFGPEASYTSTYLEVNSDLTNNGESIVVETATSPTPLLGPGMLGGQLSATRIQGADGWIVSRQDADGEWHGIAWQATPNRIVAVSGHAPLTIIQATAESLVIVKEDEWKTALPNYTTD